MSRHSREIEDDELRHFRQFLGQLVFVTGVFATVEIVSALVLDVGALARAGLSTYFAFAVGVIARSVAKRERLGLASLFVGYAMLLVILINAPSFTVIAPTLAIIPFVAFALVLPLAKVRALQVFFVATLVAEMTVAGFGVFFPGRPALSPLLGALLSTSSVAVAADLALVLLLQFRSQVKRALDQSKDAIRARDEFISIASRELLTPLNSLSLNTSALMRAKNQVPAPPLESLSGKIENVDHQTRRFSGLVNELLDISRIASRPSDPARGQSMQEISRFSRSTWVPGRFQPLTRSTSRRSSEITDDELRHFRQFLGQLFFAGAFFGAVELVSAFILKERVLAIAGLTSCFLFVVGVISRMTAKREQLGPVSLFVGYAFVLAAFINAPFFTLIAPTLAIVPFIAVALVLPHVAGRALKVFFVATLAAELAVAGFGVLLPGRPSLPPLFKGLLSTSSVAMVADLVLVLLLQFRSRVKRSLDQSKDAIRARDEFISIASHELLTPLTPLSLNTKAMMRASTRVPSPPVDAISGKIENIDRQVRRLNRLVNELLDISRIASRRLSLELSWVDLGAIARGVVSGYEAELTRAGCVVFFHIDPERVRGEWDADRLEQVLWNLLANAAKFGAGKPIEISISASKRAAILSVKDHGIGISPGDQRRIFDQFERAVSTRHYGGFGLGLWISRMIVESMGGSIGVDSKPGQGSIFTLQLPQSHGESAAAAAAGG